MCRPARGIYRAIEASIALAQGMFRWPAGLRIPQGGEACGTRLATPALGTAYASVHTRRATRRTTVDDRTGHTRSTEGSMTAPVIEGRRPNWDRGMQWKPVVAGALAGFAVMIILTTLGAALGVSAADAADGADGRAVGAAVAERGAAPRGSPADTARIAETAANVGKGAAWGLLLSQLLGLGATIFGARMRRRQDKGYTVTRDATVVTGRDVAA
jgi:hypothetical protein